MLYQFERHPRLRDANHKLKRLHVLISNLQTYLVQNATSISITATDIGQVSRYRVVRPKSAANSLINARMNKKRQMR